MLDFAVLPGFVAVILVFLAPPGPDMTYMLAVGLEGGRGPAVRAILGIGTGMAVYAAAVVVGLGRIAQTQPQLLVAVKVLGALYLGWLAFSTLRHDRDSPAEESVGASRRWYLRGLTVSLTNPKLILFFLAVLPRFVGHAQNPTAQMALLGAVNVATEVVLYGGLGIFAGLFHSRVEGRPGARIALNYLAAVVYAALAVLIVVETLRG